MTPWVNSRRIRSLSHRREVKTLGRQEDLPKHRRKHLKALFRRFVSIRWMSATAKSEVIANIPGLPWRCWGGGEGQLAALHYFRWECEVSSKHQVSLGTADGDGRRTFILLTNVVHDLRETTSFRLRQLPVQACTNIIPWIFLDRQFITRCSVAVRGSSPMNWPVSFDTVT